MVFFFVDKKPIIFAIIKKVGSKKRVRDQEQVLREQPCDAFKRKRASVVRRAFGREPVPDLLHERSEYLLFFMQRACAGGVFLVCFVLKKPP